MDTIHIDASERAPAIDFNFSANHFAMRGESYPEDVAEFYGPILTRFKEHVAALAGASLVFDFDLIYFNSSSAKVLMGLFDTLDKVAAKGNKVIINWHFEEDDDNMEELGGEFGEELHHAEFHLLPKAVQ
ncbi:MAG: DUF1987 domain-containing protein [Magnetococcales bacterium]|nr:DUF1987 domain-containing protein [Magnetococcales bacterium]